jgi:hypothetical protein
VGRSLRAPCFTLTRRGRISLAVLITSFVAGGLLFFRDVGGASGRVSVTAFSRASPPPPGESNDRDGDGLEDGLELQLAARHAPAVILDGRDWTRPASIPWLLARLEQNPLRAPTDAGLRGWRLSREARAGSHDPRDWTTYAHVYPGTDGGIRLQYWFLYAYNDGPLWFDHDSDWEHVTVRLDRDHVPLGAYLARHEHNNPGPYRAWNQLRKMGGHPVILSARGTHASYSDPSDLPWFESASSCRVLEGCPDPVWRTWEGMRLVNLGERRTPLIEAEAIAYRGHWGSVGSSFLPGTSAPRGPLHQRGFCCGGLPGC